MLFKISNLLLRNKARFTTRSPAKGGTECGPEGICSTVRLRERLSNYGQLVPPKAGNRSTRDEAYAWDCGPEGI